MLCGIILQCIYYKTAMYLIFSIISLPLYSSITILTHGLISFSYDPITPLSHSHPEFLLSFHVMLHASHHTTRYQRAHTQVKNQDPRSTHNTLNTLNIPEAIHRIPQIRYTKKKSRLRHALNSTFCSAVIYILS